MFSASHLSINEKSNQSAVMYLAVGSEETMIMCMQKINSRWCFGKMSPVLSHWFGKL